MASKINDDLSCNRLTPKSFDCPANSITNPAIPAGEQLDATKVRHHHHARYAQLSATTTTAATQVIHVARFAGTLMDLVGGVVGVLTGNATTTIDIKKNNVSVLSGTIGLDNANTARVVEAATINPSLAAYVAGDVFEIVITVNAGTGALGTGVFAEALFDEKSQ